jgi:hypothetical protein
MACIDGRPGAGFAATIDCMNMQRLANPGISRLPALALISSVLVFEATFFREGPQNPRF